MPEADALVHRIQRSAAWVVGCSSAILQKGRELAPEIIPRSSVIYNAVSAPHVPPETLTTRTQQILCIGRLSPEKGFDLALTAFSSLATRFPHARFIFAGDGDARRELERQATNLGIAHRSDFMGWVTPEKMPSLINAADMVVMPSREESFGLVALEAALMARPVVGTCVGGLPEVVVDGQTGLLVEPENSQALAQAIAYLLEHAHEATQMGQSARTRARQLFGWEQHLDAYDVLYRRLAAC